MSKEMIFSFVTFKSCILLRTFSVCDGAGVPNCKSLPNIKNETQISRGE